MTEPLTRPLFDNRTLRATGGADLSVSLGTSMRAVFDTPMMTGLVGESIAATAREDAALAGPDVGSYVEDRVAIAMDISRLEQGLSAMGPGQQREDVLAQVGDLKNQMTALRGAYESEALAAGRMRTKDDLQEAYGDLGLQFDRPMSQEEADALVDSKRAETIRNSLIQAGPQGILPTAAKFGAGLAAMAVDPLEVATMFIPVVGQAGKLGAIARFGRVGGRVAVGATEGFVGNLMTEPVYYGLSRQQQLDYDMSDALLNVGLGAVFGAGIGSVAGVLSRADVSGAKVELPDIEAAPVRAKPEGIGRVLPDADRIKSPLDLSNREAADIALRQFVTDQPTDVGRVLGGRGLRSTTSLTNPGAIDFPAARGADGGTVSFTTEQGSTYEVFSDGTTARNKAARSTPGHEGDFGEKRRTVRTIYLEKLEDAAQLTAAGLTPKPRARVVFSKTGNVVSMVMEGKEAGKWGVTDSMRAGVKYYTEPAVGRYPLELWQPRSDVKGVSEAYGGMHAGNVITEVNGGRAPGPKSGPNVAEYYAKQSTGDASQAPADLRASDSVAAELSGPKFETVDEILADTDDLDLMVRQIDETEGLDADERAYLDEVSVMQAHADDYSEIAEAAAICMGRT